MTAQIEMRREPTCPASHQTHTLTHTRSHTHATFMAHSFFISPLCCFVHSLLFIYSFSICSIEIISECLHTAVRRPTLCILLLRVWFICGKRNSILCLTNSMNERRWNNKKVKKKKYTTTSFFLRLSFFQMDQ